MRDLYVSVPNWTLEVPNSFSWTALASQGHEIKPGKQSSKEEDSISVSVMFFLSSQVPALSCI